MDWRIIIAICFAFFAKQNVGFEGCSLPEAGYSWQFNEDKDLFLPNINSSEICGDLCLKNKTCHGFSWEKGDIVSGYCVHYAELQDNNKTCEKCISNKVPGSMPSNLVCSGDSENVVGYSPAVNEQQCWEKCAKTDGCNHYTWFNKDALFQNTCFMFKNCKTTKEIANSVSRSCNLPPIPQCEDYTSLTSSLMNAERHNYRCQQYIGHKSGWYRMKPPAGDRMPEYPPGPGYCSVNKPGWMNGTHPTSFGSTNQVKICFRGQTHTCEEEQSASVTNCGNYFVYLLSGFEQTCSKNYCAIGA